MLSEPILPWSITVSIPGLKPFSVSLTLKQKPDRKLRLHLFVAGTYNYNQQPQVLFFKRMIEKGSQNNTAPFLCLQVFTDMRDDMSKHRNSLSVTWNATMQTFRQQTLTSSSLHSAWPSLLLNYCRQASRTRVKVVKKSEKKDVECFKKQNVLLVDETNLNVCTTNAIVVLRQCKRLILSLLIRNLPHVWRAALLIWRYKRKPLHKIELKSPRTISVNQDGHHFFSFFGSEESNR